MITSEEPRPTTTPGWAPPHPADVWATPVAVARPRRRRWVAPLAATALVAASAGAVGAVGWGADPADPAAELREAFDATLADDVVSATVRVEASGDVAAFGLAGAEATVTVARERDALAVSVTADGAPAFDVVAVEGTVCATLHPGGIDALAGTEGGRSGLGAWLPDELAGGRPVCVTLPAHEAGPDPSAEVSAELRDATERLAAAFEVTRGDAVDGRTPYTVTGDAAEVAAGVGDVLSAVAASLPLDGVVPGLEGTISDTVIPEPVPGSDVRAQVWTAGGPVEEIRFDAAEAARAFSAGPDGSLTVSVAFTDDAAVPELPGDAVDLTALVEELMGG